MNEFLKSLQAFGMEGMGVETEVEAYVNSECAEELIELDNLDQATVAMEAMSDAIMEGGLEMQTLALESAGFTLDTASGFTGELSNEAVGNMIKRGYYEVKIQVKKAIQKIWKLVITAVENMLGSDGRLKSYGKLFKKYNERLSKIHPKDGKDGEDKQVTIREWDKSATVMVLGGFKTAADKGWMKELTNKIKEKDPVKAVNGISKGVASAALTVYDLIVDMGGSDEMAQKAKDLIQTTLPALSQKAAEEFEKKFNESSKDVVDDLKDGINDILKDFKDVESEEMSIWTAKEKLGKIGRTLEEECKKDMKFKAELIRMKKAWDKTTGEWNMDKADNASDEIKNASAAVLRVLNKCGVVITAFRMALSKIYSAIVSNLQGILADMAKVIAKGTNIGA